MDPRPAGRDPLAAATEDLDLLESGDLSAQDEVEAFGRVHTALASALAGSAADRAGGPPGPGR